MMRWLIRIIERVEAGAVKYIRKQIKEEWGAVVHDGRLYLSKGTYVFMLGDCQDVINSVMAKEPKQ